MSRKNIYFVETGFSFDESVYLPYATGTLAAYLMAQDGASEKYNIADFIFRREKIKAVIDKMAAPFVVAFSCSVWNFNYNLALAKKVKEVFPECNIVFGGHNVSPEENILKEYPFIDYCMYGEGERNFTSLVYALDGGNRMELTDISFRDGGNYYFMPQTTPCGLDDLPSPYLSGILDPIVNAEPETDFLCVLETNRGCPFSCAYCDWCSGKKVRQFPLEKVLDEIRWLSEHKIEYCFCADSNFGMFERDVLIAEVLADSKKKTGYPKTFRPCYAKHNDDNVFAICSILNSAKMDKGATFAYQTLSDKALENINRKNLTLEHFSELMGKYNSAGIPSYSELILGLPGETRQSFCKGICRLLESGQHNSLSVYHCELLPNSIMSLPAYKSKHKIKTIDIAFNHIHSVKKKEETEEVSHIVQSTATLSKEDWVYCNLFAICVQCFHSLGLTRFISVYLNKAEGVSYFDFYKGLLDYILGGNGKISALFRSFGQKLDGSLEGDWNYLNPVFGPAAWTFEEGAFLEITLSKDDSYNELAPYLGLYLKDISAGEELVEYQKSLVMTCGKTREKKHFSYDFPVYFSQCFSGEKSNLEKRDILAEIIPKGEYSDLKDFAREIVWYGRRRGDTICKVEKTDG